MEDGTTDITSVVESMRSTFVLLAKDYLIGIALTTPGIGVILSWLIKTIGDPAISWALNKLTNWEVMQAFFINTAIRKSIQASDYIKAVEFKKIASEADYARAEKNEMEAFYNFVRITN